MSNRAIVQSSDVSVRIIVGSYIDENTSVIVHSPLLLQGQWAKGQEPENQEEISWQEQVSWLATGPRPEGVLGRVNFTAGANPDQSSLEFQNDGGGVSTGFDGNPAPYDGQWNGQRVTLSGSLQGSQYIIQLLIGNNQP